VEGGLKSKVAAAWRRQSGGAPQVKLAVKPILHIGGAKVKKLAGIISMLALVALIGCGKPETPQEKFQKQATAKLEEMQKNIDKLKGAYDAKIAEMRKKFDEQMAAGQKHYEDAVAGLKMQEAAAKKELAAMKSATGEAWEKAKEKMDKMVGEMEKTYGTLKDQLK
jgi:TolA-binding protein